MCSIVRLRLSLRCGTHDGAIWAACVREEGGGCGWKSMDLSWFPSLNAYVHLWLAKSQPAGSHQAVWWRAADISSVFTSGSGHDKSTTRSEDTPPHPPTHTTPLPLLPPAAASLSICHRSNNNVLSLKACFNTCCRGRILAGAGNKQDPRVQLAPWNWPKITSEHLQRKSCTTLLQSNPFL